LACVDYPDGASFEDCPDLSTLSAEYHLENAWGGTPWNDSFCWWSAIATCGPEAARPDSCCYIIEDLDYLCATPGRPFRVDGKARVAQPGTAQDWSTQTTLSLDGLSRASRRKLIQHWTAAGHAEHASIASFSRFASQLLALGAPAGLVAEATRAMADEINHARLCFGIASAAAGTPISIGGIDISGSLDAVTPEQMLVDTIEEGCINETICAALAEDALEQTTDPEIHAALQQIADDESRHATLAWKTVRWLLETHPELTDLAQRTFLEATLRPTPACSMAEDGALATHGIPAMEEEQKVAARALREVVIPCASALLQKEANSEGAVA